MRNYLHPSNSKYTTNPDYFVPCGIEDCETCYANNITALQNQLTLPLPNKIPEHDMTLPTLSVVPTDEIPYGVTVEMLNNFKQYNYEDIEAVAVFYKTVIDKQLQNSNNALVIKCLKNYANYIGKMSTAQKNELKAHIYGEE